MYHNTDLTKHITIWAGVKKLPLDKQFLICQKKCATVNKITVASHCGCLFPII